jgi:hypothetical protein
LRSFLLAASGEDGKLFLARTQEIEKVQLLVSACLADAQQNQVVADAPLGCNSSNNTPKHSKGIDRVTVNVGDFIYTYKYPHETVDAFDTDLSLISVR